MIVQSKKIIYSSRWFYLISIAAVFLLITGRQKLVNNYGCEVCSDKAGYYVYLPAVFHSGFEASSYSENFDQLHGHGFHLDKQKNKVITKFTCGTALMLLPFYGAGAAISKLFAINASPFSEYYLGFINFGAACWAVLGLYFFRRWMEYYVSAKIAFQVSQITFFATHLFYYTLDESLMSHLYSFSLFSGVLYFSKKYSQEKIFRTFLLFTLFLSLAVLIRPTNILYGVAALFLDVKNFQQAKEKITLFFQLKNIASGIFIFLIVVLPQLIYWKFAYGKFVVWSYEGESFSNALHPKFLTVWFSANSGLFPYTPILFVSIIAAAWMIMKNIYNGIVVIASFIIVSYLCASWHNPTFGECNFGLRPFVDYLPILMLPICYLIQHVSSRPAIFKIAAGFLFILLFYYNQVLFSAFNTCFPGGSSDWAQFGAMVMKGLPLIR